MPVKNAPGRQVRKRTFGPEGPATRDRRVLRTKRSLHEALLGLAREKPYDAIAVKEILDRANVGKSTFYTHFRDKDELLESGIYEMLRSIDRRPRSGTSLEVIVAFSLPILEHIDAHRRADGPEMTRDGRGAMHGRLREVLTELIAEDVGAAVRRGRSKSPLPADLVARHVASTFVLALDWWVECEPALTPAEADARFRALVQPVLTTL